ncbi:1-acyl-sn-glycerol-3-phosphate acyltransferase beta-like isoform X2 [Lasioglossum baleicum]|uniref:1-acyl-sn-glycerol-3-phosphate acyltransferase beta-like isoform X2 n=1 Tax=Lasioglossum baleicum TaxID=434251 RepID=UPI003FCE8B79
MYDILQMAAYSSIGFVSGITFLAFLVSCERIRYYIKFSFFVFVAATVSGLCIPVMLLRIGHWANAIPSAWGLKEGLRFLGVRYHIRGKENLIHDSGSIILVNHQSAIDLTVLGELWLLLDRCCVIAKKEILYFGLFGVATALWGTWFIDRKKGKQAFDVLSDAGEHIKKTKGHLIVFPEGHRHSNFTLLPFKKGAFITAITKQIAIQPVVVSKYYFLNSKQKIFNSGASYMTILPAISTEGLTMDDLPAVMEKTYECMNSKFAETSQEVVNDSLITSKSEQ